MPPRRRANAKLLDQVLVRQFEWEIGSVAVHLDELRQFWAQTLSISGPQLSILTALAETEELCGMAVNVVAKMLHVDPSFVTTQSKTLEKEGLLRRRPSNTDARVVEMSLTDKARKQLAKLTKQQATINQFIFSVLDNRELETIVEQLTLIRTMLKKARLKIELDR